MANSRFTGPGSANARSSAAMAYGVLLIGLLVGLNLWPSDGAALETVKMALSNKNFQMILYPIAQERGYMQEEGIDLRIILARAELSVQATMAGSFQFNMAGNMAVVNIMKGGAPFKVILSTNDKVLSWILSKPEITTLKELKGKRVATSGVANVTLIMAKQLMQEKPKLVAGMMKASLKALRFIRNQRDATITVAMKFAGLDKSLATRMYDDLVGSFTQNGTVDEETQRNDIEVIRQILKTPETIPVQRAFDFRFAREADRQLNQSGWRP